MSTPSSQLHPPPQILGYSHPPHVAQRCCDHQSRMTWAYAFGPLPLLFCKAVTPSTSCVRGVYPLSPSLACFGLGSSLGVEGIRKRHRRRRCWSEGPLCHESRQSTPRRTIFRRWWRQILLSLGVWFRCRVPRGRPASAWVIIFIIEAECHPVPCVHIRAITFVNHDRHVPRRSRHASVSAGRGSRAYRRGHVRSEQRCSRAMYMAVSARR